MIFRRAISQHRQRLNVALARLLPLPQPALEIGNGRIRRGMDLGCAWTLDLGAWRQPDVCGDAQALPVRSGALGSVAMCETLQYVTYPGRAIQECRRVLRAKGSLVVSVPCDHAQDADNDYWRWTEAGIMELLTRERFGIRDLQRLGAGTPSGFVVEAVAT